MIIYKVQIRRAALSQLTRHLVNGSSKETHQLLICTLFGMYWKLYLQIMT